MNAVDVVQEIVGRAVKSVWPIRRKGVTRPKATMTVRLAAASGSPVRVEEVAILGFVQDGKKCNMKFLDADVKKTITDP